MPSETSVKIFSGRALNRGRRTKSRVLFGYFLHDAKSDNPFPLQGDSRFCKPRISAPKQRLRTNPIKSFCRPWRHYLCASRYYQRLRRFFSALRQCPCRDGTLRVLFRRHRRRFFPPDGGVMLLPQHFLPPSATILSASQKVRPCRDGTLRVLFLFFLLAAKRTKTRFLYRKRVAKSIIAVPRRNRPADPDPFSRPADAEIAA